MYLIVRQRELRKVLLPMQDILRTSRMVASVNGSIPLSLSPGILSPKTFCFKETCKLLFLDLWFILKFAKTLEKEKPHTSFISFLHFI